MPLLDKHFFTNCWSIPPPEALSILDASVSAILSILSIFGNTLIILAVILDPNKNLRTPFNWLIVNLAVADLIMGIVVDVLSVFIHVRESLQIKITDSEVVSIHLSYFIASTASVLFISSLAIERYLAVRNPCVYQTRVTNKRIIFAVIGIWLISLSLPNIYFLVGVTLYAFVFVNTSVFLAVAITCFSYTLMWRKIKRKSQEVINNNRGIASESPRRSSAASNKPTTSNSIVNNVQHTESKVTKMFLVVLVVMFCCYGPATMLIYFQNFCASCSCTAHHWFRDLQFLFTLTNSSLNFFCYAMQSSRFRNGFMRILKIKKSHHRQHELPSEHLNCPQEIELQSSRKVSASDGFTNEGLVFGWQEYFFPITFSINFWPF